MEGVQEHVCWDLFQGIEIMQDEMQWYFSFTLSYYEIYSGKIYDLLNNHAKLKVQEDKNQTIWVSGLLEQDVHSP